MIAAALNILNLVRKGYKYIKEHFTIFLIGVLLLLSSIIYVQRNTIHEQDNQIGSLNNNLIEYSSTVNGLSTEKRVLKLKLSDLSNSHDKDIQTIDSLAKVLKIKPKTINSISHVETILHDTLTTYVDSTKCNFNVIIEPNKQTKFEVIRNDTLLKIIPTITNDSDLFITTYKVYRNKRSNWFSRLVHWDWKKDSIKKYEVHNSNDLIKTTGVKVIEIEQ